MTMAVMDSHLEEKFNSLKQWLMDAGSVAVAFSGGVDSMFLMEVAFCVLGNKSAAFTASTATFTQKELEECKAYCASKGIGLHVVEFDQFAIKNFENNPKDRCYICKKSLFAKLKNQATSLGFCHVVDGTNFDDTKEYRPGMKALEELTIESPLKELKFTKEEIRILSRELGIKGWDRGSFACLATRFETGAKLTPRLLRQVEVCEKYLAEKGFRQYRVRVHESISAKSIARIEVSETDIIEIARLKDEISDFFRRQGFDFITVDLKGFKSGSMN